MVHRLLFCDLCLRFLESWNCEKACKLIFREKHILREIRYLVYIQVCLRNLLFVPTAHMYPMSARLLHFYLRLGCPLFPCVEDICFSLWTLLTNNKTKVSLPLSDKLHSLLTKGWMNLPAIPILIVDIACWFSLLLCFSDKSPNSPYGHVLSFAAS